MNRVRFFSSIALLLVAALQTHAQTDTIVVSQIPDTIALQQTVIAAFRVNTLMPVTFQNVTKEDILFSNIGQEPSKQLSNSVGINSYSDAGNYSGYSYFRLRGIDQTRINITLDGIPLNEPEDQGVYFSNYPDFFSSVESYQIQRGVGTSSNGVASYAGSINFESPNLKSGKKMRVGSNYGSYNTYRLFGEYQSKLVNDKSFYARVSHLNSDGYKYNSENVSTSAFVSGGLTSGKHQLKLTGFIGQQNNGLAWIGVPLDTIKKDPRTNGNSLEKDKFSQALMALQHSYRLSNKAVLNSTVYYNYLKGNYDFDLNNFLGLPLTNEMYNYAFQHHFVGAFSNVNVYFKKFTLHSGVHLNAFQRRHIGSERSLGELYVNTGYKNEVSAFAKVFYPVGKFKLFGDVQYRYTSFDYTGLVEFNKINWHFANPKIGVSYAVMADANIYYSYGINGREPTRNDIFMGEDDLLADSLGNTVYANIAPETVFNHEVGIRIKKSKWHLFVNAYLMNFKNEIVLNGAFGPNGLPLHSSVAKSYRSGVELETKFLILPFLYYSNSSSISRNQISESDISFQPILTPQVISNNVLAYHANNVQLMLRGKYQGKSYIDFENSHNLPAFFELNLLAQIKYKRMLLKAGINNLTNKLILTNGYIGIYNNPLYFVQAPRNYFIGLEWNI